MGCRVVPRLVLLIALALIAVAWAQEGPASDAPSDPVLLFEVQRPEGGVPVFVLGINRFTLLQLSEFIAGVETFLRRAEGLAPGVQLVWRQEGVAGYLSLSTSPFADGPAFLMTLRGEPVRTFDDATAVLATMTRLGQRLLAEVPRSSMTAARELGQRPAPPMRLTR